MMVTKFNDLIEESYGMSEEVEDFQELIVEYNDLMYETITEDIDDLDAGLQIIYEMADKFTYTQRNEILDLLSEDLGLDEDDIIELSDDEEELSESERIEERVKFKQVARTAKFKKKKKQKDKAKKRIGKKADSERFKRTMKFDAKKKKYIKRDKAVSRSDFKKRGKKFAKLMKKRRH